MIENGEGSSQGVRGVDDGRGDVAVVMDAGTTWWSLESLQNQDTKLKTSWGFSTMQTTL